MMTNFLFQSSSSPSLANDPLDALIVATILIFILSTITEKFTELSRMYPGQFRAVGMLFCLFFYFQIFYGAFNEPLLGKITAVILFLFNTFLLLVLIANIVGIDKLNIKGSKLISEKLSILNNVSKKNKGASDATKEKEMSALSFMIGLIVALLFNANLFNFFDVTNSPGLYPVLPLNSNPAYPLYALDPEFFNISIIKIIGFVLTAFFLSFGAKFFHDLLDNLLQVKNLKRKANEKADWDFNNISEFDQYIQTQEQNLYEDFLNQQLNQPGLFFESDFFAPLTTKFPERCHKLIYKVR